MKAITKSNNGCAMGRMVTACGLAIMLLFARSGAAQTGTVEMRPASVVPPTRPAAAKTVPPRAVGPAADTKEFASTPFSSLMPGAAKGAPAASSGEEQEEAAKPSKPGQEGIKVHGHWTIDVRDPDGKLAQHHVFDNSLYFGAYSLVGLLSGQLSVGNWEVTFYNLNGPAPCVQVCLIAQSLTTLPATYSCGYTTIYACTGGLTMTTSYGGYYGPYSMTLAGGFTATQAGAISDVGTTSNVCAVSTWNGSRDLTQTSDVSSSACITANGANTDEVGFTDKTISPINVQSGQLIQITVTISFS